MSSTLIRADEWSEDLHRAFLSQAFIARSFDASSSSTVSSSSSSSSSPLLIKCLPHKPSKTLAIVVLPLQTFTPLYEGLAFRTLRRRIKSQPTLLGDDNDDDDEDALFDEIAYKVCAALNQTGGANSGSEYWIDAELARGEATMSIHTKDSASSFSLDLDLTALDRDEAPRFLTDHLVLPMASLSAFALGESGAAQDVDEYARTAASTDVYTQLFTRLGTGFSRYCRLFHGIDQAEETDKPAAEQTTPSAKPDTPKSEPKPVPEEDRTPKQQRKTPDSGTNDDEDDDLVIFRPTQTPSSHHRTPQSNPVSSPHDDHSRRRGRLASTTPTPIAPASETASRSGKLMPGIAYTHNSSNTRSRSEPRTEAEADANDHESDEEEMLAASAASQLKSKDGEYTVSTSQYGSDKEVESASAKTTAQEDNQEQSGSAATDIVGQTQRVSLSPAPSTHDQKTPEAEGINTDTPPATVSTPSKPNTKTATSTPRASVPTSGRGASSYRRGLAKRKRI